MGAGPNLVEGLLPELNHFPGRRFSTPAEEIDVTLPWSRIRCRVQDLTADLQVRRSAVVQRLDQKKLQGQFHKYLRRAERKADDSSNRWEVCSTCSRDKLSLSRLIILA